MAIFFGTSSTATPPQSAGCGAWAAINKGTGSSTQSQVITLQDIFAAIVRHMFYS